MQKNLDNLFTPYLNSVEMKDPIANNKYNAVRCEGYGRWFDSKGELKRYGELRLLRMAGMLKDLVCQPKVVLEKGLERCDDIVYTPDFMYRDKEADELVYEDFKGVETAEFRRIKQIWRLHGPAVLRVTGARRTSYEVRPVKRRRPFIDLADNREMRPPAFRPTDANDETKQ